MVDIYSSEFACNTYLIYNDDHIGFIVDPGYNENGAYIKHLKKLGVDIKAILLTHAHYDHIGAQEDIIKEYPEAVTYISLDESELLTNPKLNLSIYSKKLDYKPANLVELFDGEEFNVANFKIKMIATPFHTKGSACYFLEKENIIFSGDTLFYSSIGRSDLPTGSNRSITPSLEKLMILPDETIIYPGHGSKTTLIREKKYNPYLKIR